MRILVLQPLTAPGRRHGTELVAHELAQVWQEMGNDVTIAGHVADQRPAERLAPPTVSLVELPPLGPVPKWTAFRMRSAEAPGLARALEDTRPDVVVIVGLGPETVNLRHLEIIAEHGIPC